MAKASSRDKRAKARRKAPAAKAPDAFFRPFAKIEPPARPAPAPAPAPAPPPARRAAPVEREAPPGSDADSFAIHMAGVEALGGRPVRIPRSASEVERSRLDAARSASRPDLDAPARERMGSLVTEGIRFEVSDDGDRLEGRRTDLDPRELRRLRRGEYPVDGKLDLHGMTVEEARAAVEAFVRKRRADGDRVIVLVHGKGRHSSRGIAVLRGEIGAWLSQGRAAREVLAFASTGEVWPDVARQAASAQTGSWRDDEDPRSGALYVLLAR